MKKRLSFLPWTLMFATGLSAQKTDVPILFTATATKTNVLYLGVDNPVRIEAPGVNTDSLEVTINEGTITRSGKGQYLARVSAPGPAIITVASRDKKYKANFDFRSKRLPDPTPSLGLRYTRSDTLGTETFKAQTGVYMVLENFDFDARCITVGYSVTQITWSESDGKKLVRTAKNLGGKFNPEAIELVKSARPGDIFVFGGITGKCPGDEKERKLNSLIFFIEDRK